ncbi:hypothetical protein AURDEDRAFT_178544 [Auricularia subglabra TFB-10046 SS5]|uniref:Uncharacterized protein n=1 Tax=Auricularia subglabra (strain TFB-10046 / SS5) TaxID=717982 RepID=J0WKU1_AURST|nr:hypothetical protein AURDEDRAFT_178544 [Auricularia subglabra TFB-10046 SS5]
MATLLALSSQPFQALDQRKLASVHRLLFLSSPHSVPNKRTSPEGFVRLAEVLARLFA